MPVIKNIPCLSKQFVLLFSLFWAFLLCGQGSQAYALGAPESQVSSRGETLSETSDTSELSMGDLQLAEDATTSSGSVKPQQAEVFANFTAFRAPTDEEIPPYAARAPGQSFLNRIFPTTIQPNAP